MLIPGKLNILIDGQFGSTGKGLVASYIGWHNHVDIAISSASANAGHTFYLDNKKYISKFLPISGILNNRSLIYLCAGAIINPITLLEELKRFNIDHNRIKIHPRSAIIEDCDITTEQTNHISSIASTQSGVGAALVRKINRNAKLAQDNKLIKHLVDEIDLQYYLEQNCVLLHEVPQGFDLSINSGLEYPYTTSREITVSSAMSDAQVHPSYLGNVIVVIRTYPIRVGNIYKNSKMIGYSGPFYSDSKETTWEKIGVSEERTTVTNRVRRVASFSMIQYRRMLNHLKPNKIFLTFANYLTHTDLQTLLGKIPEVTHVSYDKDLNSIYERNFEKGKIRC